MSNYTRFDEVDKEKLIVQALTMQDYNLEDLDS
jgi:hypothetical protein